MSRRTSTARYAERMRAHCSVGDLERWKGAAARAGAANFSAWVRWVLDKESALEEAATRNPWVDRRSGKARQGQLGSRVAGTVGTVGTVEIGGERKQKLLRGLDVQIETGRMAEGERRGLYAESDGL